MSAFSGTPQFVVAVDSTVIQFSAPDAVPTYIWSAGSEEDSIISSVSAGSYKKCVVVVTRGGKLMRLSKKGKKGGNLQLSIPQFLYYLSY